MLSLEEKSITDSLKSAKSEAELIEAAQWIQFVQSSEVSIRLQAIFKKQFDQVRGKK